MKYKKIYTTSKSTIHYSTNLFFLMINDRLSNFVSSIPKKKILFKKVNHIGILTSLNAQI